MHKWKQATEEEAKAGLKANGVRIDEVGANNGIQAIVYGEGDTAIRVRQGGYGDRLTFFVPVIDMVSAVRGTPPGLDETVTRKTETKAEAEKLMEELGSKGWEDLEILEVPADN